jgi:mono/diheme cytochrome c family protein
MTTLAFAGVLALAAVGPLAGCRGERSAKRPRQFIPDMDDSPKWKPQVKSAFFEDSRTLRPTVPGTVAFGASERVDHGRDEFLKADDAFYTGVASTDAAGNPTFLATIPVASFDGWPAPAQNEAAADLTTRRETFMASLIERGHQRFNIYCSVCHGYDADGQGMVGQRWMTPVANLHDPKYMDAAQFQGQDGYIFNVIRHGVPFPNTKNEAMRMPAYGHSINEADAWAIVAYVRTLQATRTGIDGVPPAVRDQLRTIPKPPPKEAPAAPANDAKPQSPATPPADKAAGGGNP